MVQSINKKTLFGFSFLALVFFICNHDMAYSLQVDFDLSADFYEEVTRTGNFSRQIGFSLLGVVGVVGLMRKGRHRFSFGSLLSWLFVFFGVWSLLSILWSIDVSLTLRRLVVVIFCYLGASSMAKHYSISLMPICVLLVTSLFLSTGLLTEIVFGTFHPFTGGYRFAGTLHPNLQGINCAMMLLASVYLTCGAGKGKVFWGLACLVAFGGLVLTGSRNSFACALLALIGFSLIGTSKLRIIVLCFISSWCFVLLYIFLGDDLLSMSFQGANLGRSTEDFTTLTGRTEIWEIVLDYINQRPLHGYGFNSFWVPLHIRQFSDVVGAGIIGAHSSYLDLLLSGGLVSFLTFSAILLIGIKLSYTYCKTKPGQGYGFLFMVLMFFILHGFIESEMFQMTSFGMFVLLWGLLHLAFLAGPVQSEISKVSHLKESFDECG